MASWLASGAAVLSSTAGLIGAMTAAAAAPPELVTGLAAIGSAELFRSSVPALAADDGLPPGSCNDSSTAASAGSGAAVGSFSTCNAEKGLTVDDDALADGLIKRGVGTAAEVSLMDDGSAVEIPGDIIGLADFASFFRNSPLATRRVPFACSTLIGLVSTRLAPMRKAAATPACPSTTATISAP